MNSSDERESAVHRFARRDDAAIADLRHRLRTARLPDDAPRAPGDSPWARGVPLAYLQELVRYWRDDYDWAETAAELDAIGQWATHIDGVDVHFLHGRSPRPDAQPLLLTHGWPGSVVEYLDVIEPLTDPKDPTQPAFHVIAPALPGFGFSSTPPDSGWGTARIADAWAELLTRLGYDRFYAHGGDWGSEVTAQLGVRHSQRVGKIHLTFPQAPAPDDRQTVGLTERERDWVASTREFWSTGTAYAHVMATAPQTIGYALVDSPVALLAWSVDKFAKWTDTQHGPEDRVSRHRILDNVTMHWLGASGASAARIYYEDYGKLRKDQQVEVPTAISIFPAEIEKLPRAWVAERFPTITSWREPAAGGHFASLEVPELFVNELRHAFR